MMNIARREKKIQTLPVFPMQKESNTRQGFVESEKFADVLAFLPEGLRPLCIFLYRTGCRVGAARQISWSMLNAETTKMTLPGRILKNDRPLTIPLPSEVTDLLRKMFRVDEAPVFSTLNLRREWGKATKAAGVPELLIHDLRRSGARNLRESGVDETVIMKIGGWKTRSVFIRYAIVSTTDMEAAFAKLEKAQGNFDDTSEESVGH